MLSEFRKGLEAIHFVAKGASWGQAPSVFFREHDEDVEVWGVNNMFYNHRNLDRSFLLHDPRQEVIFEDKDFFHRVQEIDHPIYTNRVYKNMGPMNREFPAEYILNQFPFDYYTNVVCWMIALAILLEPGDLYLHGVDMIDAVEYANERGGTEHWVGVAVGRGINVHLPSNSTICTTQSVHGPVYGYIPKRKKTGLIYELRPDYNHMGKPQLLKDYVLLSRKEYEDLEIACRDTGTKRVQGDSA